MFFFLLCIVSIWMLYRIQVKHENIIEAAVSIVDRLLYIGSVVKGWGIILWERSQTYAIFQNLSSYIKMLEKMKLAKYIRFVRNYPLNGDVEVFQFEIYGIGDEYKKDYLFLKQLLTLQLRDFYIERLGCFVPCIYLTCLQDGGFEFWIAKNRYGDRIIFERMKTDEKKERPDLQVGLSDAMDERLPALGWDLEIYETYGMKKMITLDIQKKPSGLVTGASGSGKSYFVTAFLNHILRVYGEMVIIYYCDFKAGDDTEFLRPYDRYFSGEACVEGLAAYYKEFQAVRDGQRDGKLRLLFFDEWAGFLLWETQKSKKQADIYKGMLQEILLMGRSLLCGAWIILQRPDSAWLGGRENFHSVCCFLSGGVSSELGKMISLEEETVEKIRQRDFFQVGEAVFKSDGRKTVFMKTGKITDVEFCQNEILDVLLREDGEAVRAEAETPPS